jgi:hypothetical protein
MPDWKPLKYCDSCGGDFADLQIVVDFPAKLRMMLGPFNRRTTRSSRAETFSGQVVLQ